MKNKIIPPADLRRKHGQLRELPEKLRPAFACPVCGAELWCSRDYWTCPKGFHSKAQPDDVIQQRLAPLLKALGDRRRSIESTMRFVIRRQRWLAHGKGRGNFSN